MLGRHLGRSAPRVEINSGLKPGESKYYLTQISHVGIRILKASNMVSDQSVLRRIYTPRRLSGRFASYSHRGVNEKQPLRGIYFIARNMYFHEGFIASERLFLDNPTMDGAAPAGTGLRGDGQKRYSLVGDHVSVLHVP